MRLGQGLVVFASCVWALPAVASDGEGQVVDATAEAQAAPPPSGEKAIVTVRSTGDSVTVARVVNRMVASGYTAGGSVVVAGVSWKDLCTSPCTVKLDPGFHELMVYGSGIPAATEKFDLRSGKHELEVAPGSAALLTGGYVLTAVGFTALLLGGILLLGDADSFGAWALPMTIGGAAGTGVGIGMMLAGGTSLERVAGSRRPGSAGASLGLGYRGAL